MDSIFNRSSIIIKHSEIMRKSTRFMSRVSAKPDANYGSESRSAVSSPWTIGGTPNELLAARKTKTVHFDLDRDSKRSLDGNLSGGIQPNDKPRRASLALIAEDSERSGERSSSSSEDSQVSATSLLSDISMMLGDDNRSSSSHCGSQLSGSGGQLMRYKII